MLTLEVREDKSPITVSPDEMGKCVNSATTQVLFVHFVGERECELSSTSQVNPGESGPISSTPEAGLGDLISSARKASANARSMTIMFEPGQKMEQDKRTVVRQPRC